MEVLYFFIPLLDHIPKPWHFRIICFWGSAPIESIDLSLLYASGFYQLFYAFSCGVTVVLEFLPLII